MSLEISMKTCSCYGSDFVLNLFLWVQLNKAILISNSTYTWICLVSIHSNEEKSLVLVHTNHKIKKNKIKIINSVVGGVTHIMGI